MLRLVSCFSFVWLLMAISAATQSPPVLDADGRPVQTGVKYYILPAATDIAGGLTLIDRNGTSCPSYVGQEPLRRVVSRGLPVTLVRRVAGEKIVREETDYSFVFSASTTCVQGTAWQLGEANPKTRRTYIVAGEEPVQGSPDWDYLDRYFKIVKNELGLYTFRWCPDCLSRNCPKPLCGSLGISVEDRKRLLTLYSSAFPFIFRRA